MESEVALQPDKASETTVKPKQITASPHTHRAPNTQRTPIASNELVMLSGPSHSSQSRSESQHVRLGAPLPISCQHKLALATDGDLEFWHQLPQREHSLHAPELQALLVVPSRDGQPNRPRNRPPSLPTPPPELQHYYHHISLRYPKAIDVGDSQDSSEQYSLTFITHVTSLGIGSGNGWFLHHLPLYDPLEVAFACSTRHFIPYLNAGCLEVAPSLITRICPADLCHKPCPYDNIYSWDDVEHVWRFGCRMLRLCEVLHAWPFKPPPPLPQPLYEAHPSGMTAGRLRRRTYRYSERKGPFEPLRLVSKYPVNHAQHIKHCPYIHGVEKNCRDLARSRRDGYNRCPYVLQEGIGCAYGHDFEEERLAAHDRLKYHIRLAEAGRSKPGRVWRNEKGKWMGLDQGSMVREEDFHAGLDGLLPNGEEGEEFLRGLNSH